MRFIQTFLSLEGGGLSFRPGLLTQGNLLAAPSRPMDSGKMRFSLPLQLRDSGGFSPRFPQPERLKILYDFVKIKPQTDLKQIAAIKNIASDNKEAMNMIRWLREMSPTSISFLFNPRKGFSTLNPW